LTSKIEGIFFDVGGVLGAPAVSSIYQQLITTHPSLSRERFRALLMDKRVLTGSIGTLDSLLATEYDDLTLATEEILSGFRNLAVYRENIAIAKALRVRGYCVGIISDQIAETAQMLRQTLNLENVFDPLLFSPELHLTKSTRDIFDNARHLTGYEASQLLMIDDHQFVLDIANEAGWKGLLYRYPSDLREQLRPYGVL